MKLLILILGFTSFILLLPSLTNLIVFTKGDLVYPESIGLIFAYLTFLSLMLFLLQKKLQLSKVKNKTFKLFSLFFLVGLFTMISLLVVGSVWMRFTVKQNCQDATRTYRGNCIEALVAQLQDEKQNLHSRNSAIWTLGQLADKSALPILNKYYTGNIPSKESLYKTLSQYELKKAIKWCTQGNITSWMYFDQANWK